MNVATFCNYSETKHTVFNVSRSIFYYMI